MFAAVRPVDPAPRWHALADGREIQKRNRLPSTRRTVATLLVAVIAALVSVTAGSAYLVHRAAEKQSVADAKRVTNLWADLVVIPQLRDSLVTGDPTARAAIDAQVTSRLRRGDSSLVRVKIWRADGLIVYSDEPRLVGRSYPLGDDELAALRRPSTEAEISDLGREENRFERQHGRLLEVYRPVTTPSGQTLLFETYTKYDAVLQRGAEIWSRFALLTVGSLLLLLILLIPIAALTVRHLRAAHREREELLRSVVRSSEDERRRIARDLHDGVVQDLAGVSYLLAGVAQTVPGQADPNRRTTLDVAAAQVRESIGGLRSLLIEIYPPNLERLGLAAALADLVGPLRGRGLVVSLDVPDQLPISSDAEALVFRVAQEGVRNVVRHAGARTVDLRVECGANTVTMTLSDDGCGFDVASLRAAQGEAHMGLRLLADLVQKAGGLLGVATRPQAGTQLRAEVPTR